MSDSADTGSAGALAAADGTSSHFTERELQMLGWAMQSLKSGPPEIDYNKLAAFAGMGNPRSASNAWTKIKNKLLTPSDGSTSVSPAKKTPKKKATAPKKEGSEDVGDEDAEATPKTPRKRAAKKQEADGEGSPKKKGRKPKAKVDEDTTENKPNIKSEDGDEDSAATSDAAVVAAAAEEQITTEI